VAKDGHIQVNAVAFSPLIQQRELDWEPPMRELMQKPENAVFVWKRLQYVFGLPDPREFPKVEAPWATGERELLLRFIEHARSLAAASMLGADDNVRVSIADFTDEESIESELSPQDVTTGFLTMLRQCYADGEEASFSKAVKVLTKRLAEGELSDALGIANQWRKAHAGLTNKSLEERVQEQMIQDGKMPGPADGPNTTVVRDPASPRELLLAFQYGGLIHWGKHRTALAALQRDPFEAAMSDMAMRAAALDFSHFYLGFAVLIERALDVKS
jgi:hypothetical protein